jgi:hypothetical protein
MAIELQEYIGSFPIHKDTVKNNMDYKESFTDINPISENSIMQEIEGLHVGPTRNFTWYMDEALTSSIPSWTKPYQKPLIMHHNETDGKIIGRIVDVEHKKTNTRSGTPALLFTCNVSDKDGIEQIQDGRLKTVSVGVTAHDVRCSICGKPIELDEDGCSVCGHERGQVYDGKVCYWNIYDMEAKELSYVIVPSDIYTHNLKTYKPTKQQLGLSESLNTKKGENKIMEDNKELEVKEKTNIDETVKPEQNADKTASTEEIQKETEKSIIDKKDEEIASLTAEINTLKEENEKASKELTKVKTELEIVLEKVSKVETQLKQEVTLKEAAESKLIDTKAEMRECYEESLNAYRTALNKPIMLKESLGNRSVDSIKDSICDLKEELQGFNNVKQIKEVKDPTLKAEDEFIKNQDVDVKESNIDSNINMTETARDILQELLR